MIQAIVIQKSAIERLTETNLIAVVNFIKTLGGLYEATQNRDRREDEMLAGIVSSFQDVETDYNMETLRVIRRMRNQLYRLDRKAQKHHVKLLNRKIYDDEGRCLARPEEIEQAGLMLIQEFEFAA